MLIGTYPGLYTPKVTGLNVPHTQERIDHKQL